MDAEDREAAIRELTQAHAQRLREDWPEGEVDIPRKEETVERIGDQSNRDLAEQWIREQAQREPIEETACPSCGGRMRYKGRDAQEVIAASDGCEQGVSILGRLAGWEAQNRLNQ